MNLKLIRPTQRYAEQVMRFREELLANGVFNREDARGDYRGNSPCVEYQYDFEIGKWQKVDTIEAIGFNDYESDKDAVVFLSSFNAG